PEVAVFAGATGEESIRGLIETARPHLAPGGLLALEIGLGQAETLSRFLAEKNYHHISGRHDYAGVTRFLFARYG
ncbi:MAG: peptide chain release factor N(5)-glutamine methyltransferase, partial [Chthoniobacterales bacterium]